ncbi:MAG: hypothetical protein HY550_02315 [Elusimicrobia bacterium]|nr:hypothetical protein [Elusimicrobiota bacterium]
MTKLLLTAKRMTLSLFAFLLGSESFAGVIELPSIDNEPINKPIFPGKVFPQNPEAKRQLIKLHLPYTSIPKETWDYVAVLCNLAEDVFVNPEISKHFAENPKKYLQSIGLKGNELNPEMVEVKVILAMGNQRVRAAVVAHRPDLFIKELEALGMLDKLTTMRSAIAEKCVNEMMVKEIRELIGRDIPITMMEDKLFLVTVSVVAALVAVIVGAVVWSQVGGAFNVGVAVNAAVEVNLAVEQNVTLETRTYVYGEDEKGRSASNLSPFMLARFLGGEKFSEESTRAYTDKFVEDMASTIENLKILKEHKTVIDGTLLRSILRKQIQTHILKV